MTKAMDIAVQCMGRRILQNVLVNSTVYNNLTYMFEPVVVGIVHEVSCSILKYLVHYVYSKKYKTLCTPMACMKSLCVDAFSILMTVTLAVDAYPNIERSYLGDNFEFEVLHISIWCCV